MSEQLYRMYDAEDRLLYVGISKSALVRLTQHAREKDWYKDIAYVTFENLECGRAEALEIERATIRRENPKYNVVHIEKYSPEYVAQFGVPITGIPPLKSWVAIPNMELLPVAWVPSHIGRVTCITKTKTVVVRLEFSDKRNLFVDYDSSLQWRRFQKFWDLRQAWFDKDRIWPVAA